MKYKINQFRWIIKDSENQVIYDTEINGYEGLVKFPAVVDSLELITSVERTKVKNKKNIERQKIVFTLEPRLSSIFPYEQLEEMCIS